MPVTGAFHTYAKTYIATGFTVAWLYWLTWAVALGSEFTAGALHAALVPAYFSLDVECGIRSFHLLLNAFSVKFLLNRSFGSQALKS